MPLMFRALSISQRLGSSRRALPSTLTLIRTFSSTSSSDTRGPLSGVTIVDISRLFPGPYATQLLRDLGARVIKVEEPRGGDYIRHYEPKGPDGNSAMFHAINRGKESVTLNLKKDEDKEQFHSLLSRANVLVESFRPGVLAHLGIAPSLLRERYPNLIIASISGYGQEGSHALKAGHDINYCARAGVLGMTRGEQVLPVQVADLLGGAWPAALQITAALYGQVAGTRNRGCHIDVSMADGAYATLVLPLSRHAAANGQLPIGGGKDILSGALPCYDVYATADGQIAVGALEEPFWRKLIDLLGLGQDVASAGTDMTAAGAQARAALTDYFQSRSTNDVMSLLRDHDVMVEVVTAPEDAAALMSDRPLTIDVDIQGRMLTVPRTPLSLELTGGDVADAGPALGAANESLLDK